MSPSRTRIGVLITTVWITVVLYLVFRDPSAIDAMKPNELGDFLAGTVAPLAFLWLVLGYFQQGDELRQSTEALRLQAEELKNSVEQQRELVEVSRLQVESEREALAFERRLREEISAPKFSVSGAGGTFRGDGQSTYNIRISNAGHEATAFIARIQLAGHQIQEIMNQALFPKGAGYNTAITLPTPLQAGESFLLLLFNDGLGRSCESKYLVTRESDDKNSGLSFQFVNSSKAQ